MPTACATAASVRCGGVSALHESREHLAAILLFDDPLDVLRFVHPFARGLVPLPVALDQHPLGFQRVIDVPDDHRHGVERQRDRPELAEMVIGGARLTPPIYRV